MNPPQAPVSPLRKLPPLNSEHSGAPLHRPKGPDHAISLPTMASHLSTADAVHRSMISPASTLPVKRDTSSETNMTPTSPVRKTSMSQPFMRPIKFVSNDGLPHSKRRRIKSACRTCQKRKTKCSGEEPVCETCIQNGHKCLGYNKKPPQTNKSQRRESGELQVLGERDAETGKSFDAPRSPKLLSQPPKMHQRHASQPTVLPSQYDGFAGTDGASVESDTLRGSDGKRKYPNDTFYDMPLSPTAKRRNSESRVQSLLSDRKALRMPYFRYFGPTAIVPGYKQMVVEVRSKPAHSGSATASVGTPSSLTSPAVSHAGLCTNSQGPNTADNLLDEELPVCHACNQRLPASRQPELPVYDPNDTAPNHTLITHLVKTFFEYVGCSFPFLREDAFIQDVESKQVDSMLVDVVCAVAARFSEDPLLDHTVPRSARGAPFASRSKALVMQEDTWACPNLAAVQTLLLLAYADFSNGKDSGLWMLLGDAIRMAQDLGLHKLEGMRGEQSGRINEERKAQEMSRNMSQTSSEFPEDSTTSSSERPFRARNLSANDGEDNPEDPDDLPEKLTERTDTFWCLYFLDRAISSGLGRPVTLRDEEIEIDMPYQDASNPQPFPALIRMVRLYGQTTDIVNKIKKPADGSSWATRKNLLTMDNELSTITQNMPEKLEFKLPNFRRFSACGESANFVMFHVWLQALCLLIHRPSLSIGFEIPPLQENSYNLALDSAQTIADIARFATKEFRGIHGNPFNSQPIYLAGCAFLEVACLDPKHNPRFPAEQGPVNVEPHNNHNNLNSSSAKDADSRELQMLNHARKFQDCYDIIGSLENYWKGVGYLLTVLDQKKQGIADPLLYTKEEMESATRFQGWYPKLWKFHRNLQRGGLNEADDVAMQDEANSQMEQQMHEGPNFSGDINQVSAWSFAGVAGLPTAELSVFYNPPPESPPRNMSMQNNFGVPPQPMQQQHQMLPPFTDNRTPMNHPVSLPGPNTGMLGNHGPHPLPIATGVSAPFDHPIVSSMPMAPPQTAYEVGYGPGNFMPLPVFGGGDFGTHSGNMGFLAESENVDINTLGLDMNQYLYQIGTYQ